MTYKAPKSTSTEPGLITLAGDLAGSATSPTVVNISACPVLVTDTTGVLLGKTSSSNKAMRIAPLIGQETSFTGVWVGNSAVSPTGGNYLMALEDGSGTSFIGIGTGTLNLSHSTTHVGGIVSLGNPTVQWDSAVVSPRISQADNTTNSATATTLSIAAQNATGTTSIGGSLIVAAGAGTSTNGTVSLQSGNTATLVSDSTGVVLGKTASSNSGTRVAPLIGAETSYSAIWTGTNVPSPLSSNYTMALSPIENYWQGAAGLNLSFSTTRFNSSNTGNTYVSINAATTASLTFSNLVTTAGINQSNNTANGGTGATLTIQAQNETGTTSTGGQLSLTSGTGTTAAGPVVIQTGGTTRLTANASGVITIANLGTGIVHSDSSGNLTSTAVVNADVSATAAIVVTKLAAGSDKQILLTNSTTPTWTTVGGDATIGSTGSVAVVSITGASGVVNVAASILLKNNVFNDATATPVTTTDGTLTTIYTDTAIPASTVYDYVVSVIGLDSTDGYVYRADFSFTYQRIASAAPTVVGASPAALNVRTSTGASAWPGASIALSTNSVIVQVQGVSSRTVDWNCSINRLLVA